MVDDDVIRLALDMDGGNFWLGRNGQWADGDPATGMNPSFSGLPAELYAAMMAGSRQRSSPPDFLTAITNVGPAFSYPVPEGFNVGFGPTATPVTIDIKPGSDPNSVNPVSKQNIPVTVFTTDTFDATQVDVTTVAFGPDGAYESHNRRRIKDIAMDGDADLILHFKTQETGIQCGDTEATLTGETFAGEPITGSDAIRTVNCP